MEEKNEEVGEYIPRGSAIWYPMVIHSEFWLTKPDKWFKIWFYVVSIADIAPKDNSRFFTYRQIIGDTGATYNQVKNFLKYTQKIGLFEVKKVKNHLQITITDCEYYQRVSGHLFN